MRPNLPKKSARKKLTEHDEHQLNVAAAKAQVLQERTSGQSPLHEQLAESMEKCKKLSKQIEQIEQMDRDKSNRAPTPRTPGSLPSSDRPETKRNSPRRKAPTNPKASPNLQGLPKMHMMSDEPRHAWSPSAPTSTPPPSGYSYRRPSSPLSTPPRRITHQDSLERSRIPYQQSGGQPGMEQHSLRLGVEDDSFSPSLQYHLPRDNTRWGKIDPKLKPDKSNLIEWFVAMQLSLTLDGLYDPIFNGTCTKKEDIRAWSIIRDSLPSNLRAEVQFHFKEPRCSMRTLNTMYGTTDHFTASAAFNKKITTLFLQNYKTPMDMFDAAVELNNEANWLRHQDMEIQTESAIAQTLSLGLCEEWESAFST